MRGNDSGATFPRLKTGNVRSIDRVDVFSGHQFSATSTRHRMGAGGKKRGDDQSDDDEATPLSAATLTSEMN